MNMENEKVTISVESYKLIIAYLSKKPYYEVANIIAKLAEDSTALPKAEKLETKTPLNEVKKNRKADTA